MPQQCLGRRSAISRQWQQGKNAPSGTPRTLQVPAFMCRLQLVLVACRGAQAAADPASGTSAVKGQPNKAPERPTAFNGLGLTTSGVGPASSDVGMEGQVCSELSNSSNSDWDPWNSPADSASTDPYEDLVEPPSTRARATAAVQRAAGGNPRKLVLESSASGTSAAKAQLQPPAATGRAGLSAMKPLHPHGRGIALTLVPPHQLALMHFAGLLPVESSAQQASKVQASRGLMVCWWHLRSRANAASHDCRQQASAELQPRRRAAAVDRRM